ncbi:hypothetical protein UF75_0264 [Desulfosporosinus sp. I2]|nr:hypothetical protein UF75_0264 [Desulfosporosinus sp. I2]
MLQDAEKRRAVPRQKHKLAEERMSMDKLLKNKFKRNEMFEPFEKIIHSILKISGSFSEG